MADCRDLWGAILDDVVSGPSSANASAAVDRPSNRRQPINLATLNANIVLLPWLVIWSAIDCPGDSFGDSAVSNEILKNEARNLRPSLDFHKM